MRIVRFIDRQGQIRLGHDYDEGTAELLEGELLGELKRTHRRVGVAKLLAPIEPRAILCIGLNYRHHAKEMGSPLPEHPVLFMKNPASLNHPEDPIVLPRCCADVAQVDYEAELAVVIGRRAKDVRPGVALEHVLGYTAGNDVSARHWQKKLGGGQWVRGKSFDTFCPLGPALLTPDEVPNPQALTISAAVNGIVKQEANTSDMIFSVAELIAELSRDMTLLPGTVILTGTPSGVGMAQDPPAYLKPADVVEVSIGEFGTLRNPVVAAR